MNETSHKISLLTNNELLMANNKIGLIVLTKEIPIQITSQETLNLLEGSPLKDSPSSEEGKRQISPNSKENPEQPIQKKLRIDDEEDQEKENDVRELKKGKELENQDENRKCESRKAEGKKLQFILNKIICEENEMEKDGKEMEKAEEKHTSEGEMINKTNLMGKEKIFGKESGGEYKEKRFNILDEIFYKEGDEEEVDNNVGKKEDVENIIGDKIGVDKNEGEREKRADNKKGEKDIKLKVKKKIFNFFIKFILYL